MSENWFAKKLGQPAPERREATPPSQFTPMPGTMAPPVAQPAVPHPASAQFQAPQRFEQEWATLTKEERLENRDVAREHLINNPKPGAGNRDAQSCPECGGSNLFSRRNGAGLRTSGSYPAPQCYDCGWPVVQAGSVGGALGA